jgi:hypothetical protein
MLIVGFKGRAGSTQPHVSDHGIERASLPRTPEMRGDVRPFEHADVRPVAR